MRRSSAERRLTRPEQCGSAGLAGLVRFRVACLNDSDLAELTAVPVFDNHQAVFDPITEEVLHSLGHRDSGLAEPSDKDSPEGRQTVGLIGQAKAIAVAAQKAKDGGLRIDRPERMFVDLAEDVSEIGHGHVSNSVAKEHSQESPAGLRATLHASTVHPASAGSSHPSWPNPDGCG